ncbi:23525_t:CDS:2 [Gigaspora margarita]|uniref:23525_t:CDS:1 n=1 Tax=Gigaspora margarita TaxID=4874 RepID=A0ABN7UJK4_GIGMA|nr:23525_t:CDS:2 [Gigaspora margarita]
MLNNNPLPSPKEINEWNMSAVIKFLESRKELFLNNNDINAIRTSKLAGSDLLNYSTEKFRACGLQVGPAERIIRLSEELSNYSCEGVINSLKIVTLTLKLLREHAQKEFKFPLTTHDEIVIKYNKSILSNDATVRSIFKMKDNIELIVILDKKCFSSYKNLREVFQKHGIDNDEVCSIPMFFSNCENEENYKEVFENCVKEIKARLLAIGNFEIIGDVSASRVDYTIKKIYPQLVDNGFEEIICITEAKQVDIKVRVAQNLMQLEGSLDSNKNKKHKLDDLYPDQAYLEYVYGIVSTGTNWYFLKHTPDQIFCSQAFDYIPLVTTQLNNDEDLRKEIKTVLGKIIWMLKD